MQNNSQQSKTKDNFNAINTSLSLNNSNNIYKNTFPFINFSTAPFLEGRPGGDSNLQPLTQDLRSQYLNSLFGNLSAEDREKQVMHLAILQQHKQNPLKMIDKAGSGGSGSPSSHSDVPGSPPARDNTSDALSSGLLGHAMSFGNHGHSGSSASSLNSQQMQQLLRQQMLSPQQIQAFMQQHQLMAAHQQQAQIQEFYRQQQKQLQDLHLQISSRQNEVRATTRESFGDHNNNNNSEREKSSKPEEMQQHIMQQLVQLQLQQQQQQQQALQQQGLAAAAAAFAQGRPINDFQQLWKQMADHAALQAAAAAASGSSGDSKDGLQAANPAYHALLAKSLENPDAIKGLTEYNGNRNSKSPKATSPVSKNPFTPLYSHGICKWPGCDAECSDISQFQRHLSLEHKLDDRSTAQCRVQMQVVEQLEKQVSQEKERMKLMMAHLQFEENNRSSESEKSRYAEDNKRDAKSTCQTTPVRNIPPLFMPGSVTSLSMPSSPNGFTSNMLPGTLSHSPPTLPSQFSSQGLLSDSNSIMQNARRRHSNHVPISTELSQNQEFYKNADVRPPYTYASLIRQAIVENPDHQLTLNEIYNWFQTKFAYFRRNTATWKSAIRTNLSLHKCFKRQENSFGSYWTVDDAEFRRGRHLKRGRPRKYEEEFDVEQKSPIMRSNIDTPTSFYGNSLTPTAMRMAMEPTFNPLFANQAAGVSLIPSFARRAIASFTGSAAPSNDDEFSKSEGERSDARKRSLSPQAKRRSSDERSEDQARAFVPMATKREKRDDYENFNGGSPHNADIKAEQDQITSQYSPNNQSNNNNNERLTPTTTRNSSPPCGAIDMSRTSPSSRYHIEPENVDQKVENEAEQNDRQEIPTNRNVLISARGSFTMLHDPTSD